MSDFWSDPSSTSILNVCEQQRRLHVKLDFYLDWSLIRTGELKHIAIESDSFRDFFIFSNLSILRK